MFQLVNFFLNNKILRCIKKTPLFSPLHDLKPIFCIRNLVIDEFVITIKVCNNLLRILPGTQQQKI